MEAPFPQKYGTDAIVCATVSSLRLSNPLFQRKTFTNINGMTLERKISPFGISLAILLTIWPWLVAYCPKDVEWNFAHYLQQRDIGTETIDL
jgi:hypothetical protein